MSDSLWPHGLQHARLPCSTPTPGACSNSCPLSQWCHPTISSSVVSFSSCLWSFPTSWSSPMSQFSTSGSQSIGVLASSSVLPMNIQDWFPLGLTGWIALQSKGLSKIFFYTTVKKHQFFVTQLSLESNSLIHTWCWGWNSNTLATWWEELTHWKRPWCWERLRAGGKGDDRGWDGWMASSTQWTRVWVDSGSWWRTGWPGVLQFMGSQRVRYDWVTEMNWQNHR